jgi:hypothetical protein
MATDILKLINQLSIINQVVHMLNYQANPTLFWVLGMYDMYKNNPMPASLFTCWCAFLGSCGSLSPGVLTPWVLLPVAEKSAVTGRLRPPQRLSEAASDPRPEISSNSGPKHRAYEWRTKLFVPRNCHGRNWVVHYRLWRFSLFDNIQ